MHQTGRLVRLLPLLGTLALATAGLTSSANAEDHRVIGLADIETPAPITENSHVIVARPETLALADRPTFTAATPLVQTVVAQADDVTQLGSGMASYYGNELAGRRTANGEKFNPRELTAAHRTLPFGSKVRVTNPRSGKSVIVRINDRGPFARGRTLDMSEAAARQIGLVAAGHGRVDLALLD